MPHRSKAALSVQARVIVRHGTCWPLVVARHTVNRCIILWLSVTVHTPAHVEWLDHLNNLHGVDLAVTCNAVNACVDVWLVAKASVIGKVVDLDPFNRLTFFPCLVDLLNLRTLSLYQAMAVHTCVYTGNRGMWAFANTGVAVPTWDLVLASVQLVTELDGLLWCISFTRIDTRVKTNQSHHCGNYAYLQETITHRLRLHGQVGALISCQGRDGTRHQEYKNVASIPRVFGLCQQVYGELSSPCELDILRLLIVLSVKFLKTLCFCFE